MKFNNSRVPTTLGCRRNCLLVKVGKQRNWNQTLSQASDSPRTEYHPRKGPQGWAPEQSWAGWWPPNPGFPRLCTDSHSSYFRPGARGPAAPRLRLCGAQNGNQTRGRRDHGCRAGPSPRLLPRRPAGATCRAAGALPREPPLGGGGGGGPNLSCRGRRVRQTHGDSTRRERRLGKCARKDRPTLLAALPTTNAVLPFLLSGQGKFFPVSNLNPAVRCGSPRHGRDRDQGTPAQASELLPGVSRDAAPGKSIRSSCPIKASADPPPQLLLRRIPSPVCKRMFRIPLPRDRLSPFPSQPNEVRIIIALFQLMELRPREMVWLGPDSQGQAGKAAEI